jgi:TolB-like protein
MSYFFEGYSLDPERRELRRGAELVPVEPQVFDLLEYLIRSRDRVVSKDDVLDAVWNGRAVSESALTSRVNAARAAVGDTGEDQRLIRTLRGKGFRFIADVRESSGADNAQREREPLDLPPRLPDRPSVAVLPFANLSGDPEQEFFADGITEDILTGLSQIREFFVIARNTMFTYKGRPVDVQALSTELGVRYVLEGSVRKAGGRVRITAQLNDGTNGRQIWANHYDRDLEDVFALQDEITQTVIGVLGPELSRAEQQRALLKPPENLDAWELFHRGTFHFYKRTQEGNREARRCFERAIERDAAFAPAYAGLARALAVDWILFAPDRDADAAWHAARRAMELDGRAAISYLGLGIVYLLVRREGENALRAFQEALAINPNDAQLHMLIGVALTSIGRAEEALLLRRTGDPPKSFRFQHRNFLRQTRARQSVLREDREAIHWGQRAAQKPGTWLDRIACPAALALAGRMAEAIQACDELRAAWPALTVQVVRETELTAHPPYLDILCRGLSQAGMADT